jgi:hypothetical protein
MNSHLNNICNLALANLEIDRNKLEKLLSEQEGTDIGSFMNRVLEWRNEPKNGKQHLWEMFHEAIDMSPMGFMGSFRSFVVNALLDDAAFRIEWRKNFVDENHNLVWLPGGNCKTVLTEKDDPNAEPVVVLDNDGTQKVSLLMEAMDHKEWEVKQREEREKRVRQLFDKIRGNG